MHQKVIETMENKLMKWHRVVRVAIAISACAVCNFSRADENSDSKVKDAGYHGAYFVNGEIHVNTYGEPEGEPHFLRIECKLAKRGKLDRVSISPSETKVCFEYQTGFKNTVPGRTLYVADFDAKNPAITNAKPFANKERANPWVAYPRWTKDEKAIVYHSTPSLYLYTPGDGSTVKVSTNDRDDYRYPHGESTPK